MLHTHSLTVHAGYNKALNKATTTQRLVLICECGEYNADLTMGEREGEGKADCDHKWKIETRAECVECGEFRACSYTLVKKRAWALECVHGCSNFETCDICDT